MLFAITGRWVFGGALDVGEHDEAGLWIERRWPRGIG
jgi:hypothetical protein